MVPSGDADLRGARAPLTEARGRHLVIFNPASGRGRGRRRIALYRTLLQEALCEVTFVETRHPGHEYELALRGVDDGHDVIVAVGGDGTWSHTADALLASGRREVALGVLPNGTGNDFGRNLGFRPADPVEAVRVLAGGARRDVDVGRVETPSASEGAARPDAGTFRPRHFLNVVGFGFDIAVIDAAAKARLLKGALLYKMTALQQLFRFPGFEVEVRARSGAENGSPSRTDRSRPARSAPARRHLMLTVSNGCYFGGGFPIAPGASVSDGRLHACQIYDGSPLTRLRLFNLAEKGRHVGSDRVELEGAPAFTLSFPEPPRFEVDGDVRRAGETTLRLSLLPGALTVVAPPPSTSPQRTGSSTGYPEG